MTDFVVGNIANLYDKRTGAMVGYLDGAGRERYEPTQVSTVEEVAALSPFLGVRAKILDGSRCGTFSWTLGDFTAAIAADPLHGIYIASQVRSTTEGAWVRDAWEGFDPDGRWFGKSAIETISVGRAIEASDGRRDLVCSVALTVSVPPLSMAPRCIIWPPASGVLTVQPTGGATVNGSTAALTRTLAANPCGVLLMPSPAGGGAYALSGV